MLEKNWEDEVHVNNINQQVTDTMQWILMSESFYLDTFNTDGYDVDIGLFKKEEKRKEETETRVDGVE